MIAQIYARQDGTIAHVADNSFSITPDPDTTLVIEFDAATYSTEYQHIADNSKAAFWDGANLQINSAVYLDSAWIAARQAELTQAESIEAAQSGLLDKVLLAEQYATDIKTLYNAVLDQTENQTVQSARFNALYAVVQAAPLAFRNRIITDIQQELGFDVTGTLTATQQRQACFYLRVFSTQLATLLLARKLLS